MTNQIPVRNFFTDPEVAIVLFFKKNGSVQAVNAHSQEKSYQEATVNLEETIYIASVSFSGSIDFPYASEDLAAQQSKTTITVTARNPGLFVREVSCNTDFDYKGPECDEIEVNTCKSYPLPNGSYRVCKRRNEATGGTYCIKTTCTSG